MSQPPISRKTAIIFLIAAIVCIIAGILAMVYLPVPADTVKNIPATSEAPSSAEKQQQLLSINEQEFTVDLATTPMEHGRGLMFRHELAENHGMLFDFGLPEQKRSFWMKNTYIPLDILFIDKNGRIVHIAKNTVPLSEAHIPSQKPVRGVLEINAGLSDKFNITVGDRVRHPIFN